MEKGQATPPAYDVPQGCYQQQQQPPAVQVVDKPSVSFDKHPVTMMCPHCRVNITTAVNQINGLVPWLVCGGLALVGCFFGCCIIPFFIDKLKDSEHRCPSCQQVVGRHRLIN
ncbi:hypothetical protein BOX15_Mlig030806g1 [Macrostomum lignano]|uniref:LITAF domain-containing protein n=1 Tax=Macrostomum lignano TaxID=282301 RepID=A0A267EQ19_9PLAT|nr:hypothetical protein BOX15_Mlig030806g1 [Macrostomum lignano]